MPEKPEELEQTEVVTEFVAGSGKDEEKKDETQTETKDSDAEKEETPSEKEAEPAADEEKKEPKKEHALEESEQEAEEEKPETEHALEEEPAAEVKPVVEHSAAEDVEPESAKVNFALEEENKELRAELEALRQFKLDIENKEKDALIAKYHMLSDEDKADIVAHKEEYTLEQIDEKLALVYVRKNVDFSTVDGHQEEEEKMDSILSFSLDDSEDAEVVSDIQAAFRAL